MNRSTCRLGDQSFEILTEGERYLGLGRIEVSGVAVRSGRLPMGIATQSFTGAELSALKLIGVDEKPDEVRIRLKAEFQSLPVKLMRDHSFDPIHDTQDWDRTPEAGTGNLDLVLTPAEDTFNGRRFKGFAYRYEYRSDTVPLFYLMDRGSWELDGEIAGATVVSQSSCSAPVVAIEPETNWTTEGVIFFGDDASKNNPVMTHNLPRWASHQAFDFQFKGDRTLLGVFARVGLIRTLLQREPGKSELKTFDKHIFDQALEVTTVSKAILLNAEAKTVTDQKNLWTWAIQEIHDRARAEFGLSEEPVVPRLSQNYWHSFTVDSYRKDLLPAAKAIGAQGLFIDNMNRNAATEGSPHKNWSWNMCCGHEYEINDKNGGPQMLKRFIEDCDAAGIFVYSWTNNDQALSSPLNRNERAQGDNWYVLLEDTRQKYGGAYMGCMSVWSFRHEGARRNWIDSLKKNKEAAGLRGYLFDSFYNLGFMPIDYANLQPRTMWRELVQSFKELQDEGVHFLIESFGPFGLVQHGCPRSYNVENLFACYKVGLGTGYTTVPSGQEVHPAKADDAGRLYYVLGHMTDPSLRLFVDKKRIDTIWTDAHKQALADYNRNHSFMQRRYLQEDDLSVLWHDREGKRATVWNFANRSASLPGKVFDLTTEQELPKAERYALQACHTYAVTDCPSLPSTI